MFTINRVHNAIFGDITMLHMNISKPSGAIWIKNVAHSLWQYETALRYCTIDTQHMGHRLHVGRRYNKHIMDSKIAISYSSYLVWYQHCILWTGLFRLLNSFTAMKSRNYVKFRITSLLNNKSFGWCHVMIMMPRFIGRSIFMVKIRTNDHGSPSLAHYVWNTSVTTGFPA